MFYDVLILDIFNYIYYESFVFSYLINSYQPFLLWQDINWMYEWIKQAFY